MTVNRPREVLMQAAMEALRPHVDALRQDGWPVEVRVESDGTTAGRLEVLVAIRLDGVAV